MARILGIGNVVLDTQLFVNTFPIEDSEQRAEKRLFAIGGNVANNLQVLQQLGHDCALCATLATDNAAKRLKNALEARQIDLSHIQRFIQGSTPTSYVQINNQNGSRTIVHFRDLPEVDFDHFAKIEIEAFDWLHFEGRNLEALSGMLNIAKTFLSHQPISIELEKPRDGLESLLTQVNVIFTGFAYAQASGFQTATDLIDHLQSCAPQATIICSWGSEGAWYAAPGAMPCHQATQALPKPVDTLGAGDTFIAATVDALIAQKPLAEAVSAGNQLARRKCQQLGLDNLLDPLVTRKPIANIKHITNSRATVVPAPGLQHKVVLIKHDNEVKAYLNNCPHQDVPLDEAYKIDINPFEMTMKCSVHDAFFRIEDGVCVEGPCWREELTPVDLEIDPETGAIYIAEQ
ncbi:PfkB family carbohydrate kinase [Thiomicrospira sp. ALE5]|uniref:PfkB family carbohydrate kinase n=1 Tax=Thiomicrospira sp. ALE5 TaxID=748650 RepID=UPI0008E94DB6|nr:PfkB family carbohydrate kinase [Thiomicrospira sp. ALE5]SFR53028.1 ketohexokinase [Thiomicrospira sp. ALE5]